MPLYFFCSSQTTMPPMIIFLFISQSIFWVLALGHSCYSGQEYRRGNFIYTCKNRWYYLTHCVLPLSNRRLTLGSIDTDGDFVYQCDIQLIKPIACMYRGVRINMGQQYPANDFVITCQGLVNGGIEQRPVACMGDAWYRAAPNTIFIKNGRRYRCMINGRNGHIEPETSGIMPIL